MKNLANVSNFIERINKGTFGIVMVAMTDPSGMRKTNNPYVGRVKKLTKTTNVALGYDYVNYLKAKLAKEGLTTDYASQKPNGKSWYQHPYILVSDKDATKHYLRCYYRPNTQTKVVWLVDGREATKEEVEEIKSFIPTKTMSKVQASLGLTEENEVICRDYTFDNIILLKQGDKVYNRLNGLLTVETIYRLFDM